ncbi:hypothetical protein FB480_103425 [Agrobacterium vitis]|nr:hypothetical protein FB480_103425 [Agrobacterium vitis]
MNVEQAAALLPKIRQTVALAAPEWSVAVDHNGERTILTREGHGFPALPVARLAKSPPFDDAELVINAYRNAAALLVLLDRRTQQVAEAQQQAARLQAENDQLKAPKLARDCAMLCAKAEFQAFLRECHGLESTGKDAAANRVRSILNIGSRSDLDHDQAAAHKWANLKKDFRKWQNKAQ